MGFFCPGAPAVLCSNINPSAGLANGTAVFLHSLTFSPDTLLPIINTGVREMEVKCPYSINVVRRGSPNGIIPALINPSAKKTFPGCQLQFMQHEVQLNFATTFHKAQGLTLDRIIIDLNDRSQHGRCLGKLNWHGIFVALSRVKNGNNIRLIKRNTPSSFNYLQRLRPQKSLIEYYNKVSASQISAKMD